MNGGVSGWFGRLGSAWTNTVDTLGYELNGIFGQMTAEDKTQHAITTLLTNLHMRSNSVTDEQKKYLILTFAALADSAGLLGSVSSKLNGMTRQDLKEEIKFMGGDGVLDAWIPFLDNFGDVDGVKPYPWKSSTEQQKTINYANYHRYGLSNVPYDEYPAVLHEGEAVLTASTANELRNLLDEYRSNSQSIAVIDASINNQTTALLDKLNDVIGAITNINTNNGFTSMATIDQNNARYRLMNSMTHMVSTKDILS